LGPLDTYTLFDTQLKKNLMHSVLRTGSSWTMWCAPAQSFPGELTSPAKRHRTTICMRCGVTSHHLWETTGSVWSACSGIVVIYAATHHPAEARSSRCRFL